MPRVKRGTTHAKKRKRLLKQTKGYKFGNRNLLRKANESVVKAGVHSYVDRRKKKRDARALWNIKIGIFAKEHGLSYSKLIGLLAKKNIKLDRKILADFAVNNKKVLESVIKELV